jgi:ABC-type uncharacterized transport system substrate-binding protein
MKMNKRPYIKLIIIAIAFIMVSFCPSAPYAAEVLILGNSKLKPVTDVISGIKGALKAETVVISPEEAKNDLEGIVRKENALVVIALGKNAVVYAHSLPESIPIVYGLLIDPLKTKRKNITGVYMSTPVKEYVSFINKNLPGINKIGIICVCGKEEYPAQPAVTRKVMFHTASNPYEFIGGLNILAPNVDALLLVPNRDLITSRTLEELYLFSFKEKIPVIGISEKYVKIGSLFSLGFDTAEMGNQIGKITNSVLAKGSATGIRPSSPDKLNLYVNSSTSKTMNMKMPTAILNTAKKVYK